MVSSYLGSIDKLNYLDSFVFPRQNKRVSSLLFFLLRLTPLFLAQAASPLACFACSNFAKKNKRLLAV